MPENVYPRLAHAIMTVGLLGYTEDFSAPGLGESRTPTDLAFDSNNKFIGVSLASPGRRFYYQFEMAVSNLSFSEIIADGGIATTGRSDTIDYSLMYVRVSPIQIRGRIGRVASLGAGAGIRYLVKASQGGREVVTPEEILVQNYNRLEPQVFADLRIITSQRGLNLGFRFEQNYGQINQIERTPYSQGKVYIHFGF